MAGADPSGSADLELDDAMLDEFLRDSLLSEAALLNDGLTAEITPNSLAGLPLSADSGAVLAAAGISASGTPDSSGLQTPSTAQLGGGLPGATAVPTSTPEYNALMGIGDFSPTAAGGLYAAPLPETVGSTRQAGLSASGGSISDIPTPELALGEMAFPKDTFTPDGQLYAAAPAPGSTATAAGTVYPPPAPPAGAGNDGGAKPATRRSSRSTAGRGTAKAQGTDKPRRGGRSAAGGRGRGRGRGSRSGGAPRAAATNIGAQNDASMEDDTGDGNDASASASAGVAGNDKEARRRERLARNRESARQSRARKKVALSKVEERAAQLTEEVLELRRQQLARAEPTLRAQYAAMISRLEPIANNPSRSVEEQAELVAALKQLRERYGANCEERSMLREHTFTQLRQLLMPPSVKFMLWLSQQDASFFHDVEDEADSGGAGSSGGGGSDAKGSLWAMLCRELGLTPDQQSKLRSLITAGGGSAGKAGGAKGGASAGDTGAGVVLSSDVQRLLTAVDFVERFSVALERRASTIQQQADALRGVLTPEQTIRYLGWVLRNRERLRSGIEEKERKLFGRREAELRAAAGRSSGGVMPRSRSAEALGPSGLGRFYGGATGGSVAGAGAGGAAEDASMGSAAGFGMMRAAGFEFDVGPGRPPRAPMEMGVRRSPPGIPRSASWAAREKRDMINTAKVLAGDPDMLTPPTPQTLLPSRTPEGGERHLMAHGAAIPPTAEAGDVDM